MYPNNQQPMPPQQSGQFDFITNSDTTSKRPPMFNSTKARIIVFSIGLVFLLIISVVVMNILGSAGRAQTDKYLALATRETEIIRISTLAQQETNSPETKSLALTIKYSITTANQDTRKILGSRGVAQKELNNKLSASVNKNSDELLEEAKQNNRYEDTYLQIVFAELEKYQKELSNAATGASQSEFALLDQNNEQANLLIASKTPDNN